MPSSLVCEPLALLVSQYVTCRNSLSRNDQLMRLWNISLNCKWQTPFFPVFFFSSSSFLSLWKIQFVIWGCFFPFSWQSWQLTGRALWPSKWQERNCPCFPGLLGENRLAHRNPGSADELGALSSLAIQNAGLQLSTEAGNPLYSHDFPFTIF